MTSAWRRLGHYVRHDLREIIAPSSLPDPPGIKPERRLTLQEWRQLLSESWQDYKASWKLLSREEPEVTSEGEQAEGGVSGAQLREDIGVISRGGAAQLRPILQRMYAERLAALQDAGRAFVDGYRGGLEKAKQDTLLEDLADKLWHQTAPDNGQGQEAEGHASSLHQPSQQAAEAPTQSPSAQDAALALQPARLRYVCAGEDHLVTSHERPPTSAQATGSAVDDLHDHADQRQQQQQLHQNRQIPHSSIQQSTAPGKPMEGQTKPQTTGLDS